MFSAPRGQWELRELMGKLREIAFTFLSLPVLELTYLWSSRELASHSRHWEQLPVLVLFLNSLNAMWKTKSQYICRGESFSQIGEPQKFSLTPSLGNKIGSLICMEHCSNLKLVKFKVPELHNKWGTIWIFIMGQLEMQFIMYYDMSIKSLSQQYQS